MDFTTAAKLRDELREELRGRQGTLSYRQGLLSGASLAAPIYDSPDTVAFRRFQRLAKTNVLPAIASAYQARLRIDSITLGNGRHDHESWEAWRTARAGKDVSDAIHDAVSLGWGYVLALPHLRKGGRATTRRLDPARTIVRGWADDPTEVEYALVETDDSTYLYGPYDVFVWRGDQVEVNPHGLNGVNPVSRLGDGTSIIEPGATPQNRANQTLMHALALEKFQSFSRTTFLNVEFQVDETTGEYVPIELPSSAAEIGLVQGENVKVHESSPVSTSDLARRYSEAISHVAGACGIPATAVAPEMVASVAPALSEDAERVFQARLRLLADQYGECLDSFLLALRRAAGLADIPVTVEFDLTLPQSFSAAGDAILKATQAGIPLRAAISESGMVPAHRVDALVGEAGETTLASTLSAIAENSRAEVEGRGVGRNGVAE